MYVYCIFHLHIKCKYRDFNVYLLLMFDTFQINNDEQCKKSLKILKGDNQNLYI